MNAARFSRGGDDSRRSPSARRKRRAPSAFTALGMRAEAEPIAPGLHVVATPIGNLRDITLRALATLAAADAVIAEDTRVSHNLLAHYGVTTPLVAYHEHNAAVVRPHLLARLAAGRGAGADLGRGHAAGLRSRLQTGRRSVGRRDRRHQRSRPFRRAGGAGGRRPADRPFLF